MSPNIHFAAGRAGMMVLTVFILLSISVFAQFPMDLDGDGIWDHMDNCPIVYNPGQEDNDGDWVGDVCDGCDCQAVWGSVNGDHNVNPEDVVYLVNCVYRNACDIIVPPNCPYPVGDVNCDGNRNPVDVVHYVNYVYKNITPFPCEPCVGEIHEPWLDKEAELLAVIMSGFVCAPRVLYEQVQLDLARIRGAWGDMIPELYEITTQPEWAPGELNLGVTPGTYDEMLNGEYTAWDSLNQYYWLDEVGYQSFGQYRHVHLIFIPRLNPEHLPSEYAGLPGILWVQPNRYVGDGPNLYGSVMGAAREYIFRDAWGDCPSGCLHNHFWHFRINAVEIEFLGEWGL